MHSFISTYIYILYILESFREKQTDCDPYLVYTFGTHNPLMIAVSLIKKEHQLRYVQYYTSNSPFSHIFV